MNKAFYNFVWENFPSVETPVNDTNLMKINNGLEEVDNRVISLDSTKFDKAEAQMLVKYIEYDESTGIFKITHYNGASYTIDTLLEKLAINFDYDYVTQMLIIQLSDGTEKYVDLSALLTQYEFLDSDTVAFSVDNSGKVSAIVKEGSIEEKHLRPDYLADIRVESAKAEASQKSAAESEKNAKNSELLSESWAHGGTGKRDGEETDNSKYWSEQSKGSSDSAKQALADVEKAGKDAIDNINTAFETVSPTFRVDLSTGHLLYDAEKFGYIFEVNQNGHLEWGLAV